jgi:hypothetical protein
MNWGKYPVLLGLVSMIFVFDLVYLLCRNDSSNNRKMVILILCAAVFASVFIHSRTLVIYILMLIAMAITSGWSRLKDPYRLMGFILLSGLLTFFSFFIYKSPTLAGLFSRYFKNDSWILGLILLLTVFSSFRYPRQTFFLILWFVLCEFTLLIPINLPFLLGTQTLLDRPFLQMFIYVPLTALGGLGFAALLQWTQRLISDLRWIRPSIISLLFGFVLLTILVLPIRMLSICESR